MHRSRVSVLHVLRESLVAYGTQYSPFYTDADVTGVLAAANALPNQQGTLFEHAHLIAFL